MGTSEELRRSCEGLMSSSVVTVCLILNTYFVTVKNSIVIVSNTDSIAHEQIDFSVVVLFHCFTDLLGCPCIRCQCVPYTVTVLIVTNSIVSNSMPHEQLSKGQRSPPDIFVTVVKF